MQWQPAYWNAGAECIVTVIGNPNPNPSNPTNPTNRTNPTTKYRCEYVNLNWKITKFSTSNSLHKLSSQ